MIKFEYFRQFTYTVPTVEIILVKVEEGFAGSNQLPDRNPIEW